MQLEWLIIDALVQCLLSEHLRSLTSYEIVIPKRVDANGQPFPRHRHYLRRKRSLGFSAADEDVGNRVVNESAEMLYTFSAFGRDIDLRLVSDRDFAVGGLRVQHMMDNETWLGLDLSESSQHCFYSGIVDQDPGSSAVLSTCENLVSNFCRCVFRMCHCVWVPWIALGQKCIFL